MKFHNHNYISIIKVLKNNKEIYIKKLSNDLTLF